MSIRVGIVGIARAQIGGGDRNHTALRNRDREIAADHRRIISEMTSGTAFDEHALAALRPRGTTGWVWLTRRN